jgi:hypothetical protein
MVIVRKLPFHAASDLGLRSWCFPSLRSNVAIAVSFIAASGVVFESLLLGGSFVKQSSNAVPFLVPSSASVESRAFVSQAVLRAALIPNNALQCDVHGVAVLRRGFARCARSLAPRPKAGASLRRA